MSEISKIIEEIRILSDMEKQLENYIHSARKEQSDFRNFILEMMDISWKQSESKNIFLNKIDSFSEDFTRKIHHLENALIEVIETKKHMYRLYDIKILDPK